MINIILIISFGILFSIFATHNTSLVDININTTTINDVPIYFVVLTSICIGVLAAWFYHLIHLVRGHFTNQQNKKDVAELKAEVALLTKEVHQLEVENTKLKSNLENEDDFDEDKF